MLWSRERGNDALKIGAPLGQIARRKSLPVPIRTREKRKSGVILVMVSRFGTECQRRPAQSLADVGSNRTAAAYSDALEFACSGSKG